MSQTNLMDLWLPVIGLHLATLDDGKYIKQMSSNCNCRNGQLACLFDYIEIGKQESATFGHSHPTPKIRVRSILNTWMLVKFFDSHF